MADPPPELLAAALLSVSAFDSVTKKGSAAISDAKLDLIWEFVRTDPATLDHLRPIPGKKDWLAAMKERIFGDFREGLATTRYHLDRVGTIEGEIVAIAKAHEAELFAQGNIGIGLHSRPLVAEYQAFEMALRRSLEYLAAAVTAYFKTDGNRLRSLCQAIEGREPEVASVAATTRLKATNIEGLIGSRSGSKSVRDRLAHHESVSPGVVNIGRKFDGALWVRLHGEAEDLNQLDSEETQTLSQVLTERAERAENVAFGLCNDLGLNPASS
jgi:hypothetical protein